MRVYIGPDGPYSATEAANGRLKFQLRTAPARPKEAMSLSNRRWTLASRTGSCDGVITRTATDGSVNERTRFTGKRIPQMPQSPPDLSEVRFGLPILLFNGKDLAGWRPHESDKINGWSAQDGTLVNTTPKTDFSATGDHANLRTEAEFEDFWLHAEFLIEENRNSGIYLRGMYEAQVVDRDSRMQGIQGPGAIFGRIAPSANAGKPGGQWQIYDLTLVDRHVTVVLNGVKVIDNQPIAGPTAGAIYTDPSAPGADLPAGRPHGGQIQEHLSWPLWWVHGEVPLRPELAKGIARRRATRLHPKTCLGCDWITRAGCQRRHKHAP